MIKVITYGTYDLLHYGHIRLLERAKSLGDYLIVGVTADDFDKFRGKINVTQSLMERIEGIKSTGLADEIIVEEYEGQKIDDIKRLGVDIFTVGSDWKGQFDYLNEYCKVIYLERTEGISSSDLRSESNKVNLGIVGELPLITKVIDESKSVNGIEVKSAYSEQIDLFPETLKDLLTKKSYLDFLNDVDAVFVASHPSRHYEHIKLALERKKHVMCESPISETTKEAEELYQLACDNGCVLIDALKTAFSTAYERLVLLAKSGKIGKIVSVESTCTSMNSVANHNVDQINRSWNSISAWGPTALLPIFQILGTTYVKKEIVTYLVKNLSNFDGFSNVRFTYQNAVGSIKVGKHIKSEGELVISGTGGYIYVPAPWWNTDYFEIRYEDSSKNRRYFYQLEGEGLRYSLAFFVKSIKSSNKSPPYIS